MSYYDHQNNYWYGASASQDQATSPSAYQYDGYSYPLARCASSGGSSTTSTVPESPMANGYYYNDTSAINYSAQQQGSAYQQGPAYLQDPAYHDSYSAEYSAGPEDTIVHQGDGYVCP